MDSSPSADTSADSCTTLVVYLAGRRRGQSERIACDEIHIGLDADGRVDAAPRDEKLAGRELAILRREGDAYRVEAPGRGDVRIHDDPADGQLLRAADLLSVGVNGAVLRVRPLVGSPYKSFGEAFSDAAGSAGHSGRGLLHRLWVGIASLHHEMWTQVSPLTRWTPPLLLAVLVVSVGLLWQRNLRLERALTEQSARVQELVMSVPPAGERERYGEEFDALRQELAAARERLSELESQAGARTRVIEAADGSVVFLQGAYGFIKPDTGEPLREVPGRFPGEVGVGLGGDGEPFEIRYTGTGFVASDDGLLLTNRHVGLPWEFDETSQRLVGAGFQPVMSRLQGYLPGGAIAFGVRVIDAHDTADVALLECEAGVELPPALELSDETVPLGTEVIVLGYPAGMQALLARADPAFLEKTFQGGPLDFWETAKRLAEAGYVTPLSTVGVVGQSTSTTLVYDAETTHGGSGGPVLGLDGKVLAVNAAIIPGFGGSNLGVPAAYALELMAHARSAEPTADAPRQ